MNLTLSPFFDSSFPPLNLGVVIDDSTQAMVIPTSGTVSLQNDTVVIFSGKIVVIGVNGECSYTLTAGEQSSLKSLLPIYDLRADWKLTKVITSYYRTQYYDALPVPLITNITDNDILALLPILKRYRDIYTGEATGGTTTKLIDVKRSEISGRFVGAKVIIKSGANRGYERMIATHDGETGELVVSKAFPFGFQAGDVYEIHDGWSEVRRTAWREIVRMLISTYGRMIGQAIIDPSDYSEAHKNLCLKIICEQRTEEKGDQFWLWAQDYKIKYESIIQRERLKVKDLEKVYDESDPNVEPNETTRPLRCWAR